ncbi:MAG: hypothetical protein ACLFSG_08900, partial [Halothiobacillaceae bacterium]
GLHRGERRCRAENLRSHNTGTNLWYAGCGIVLPDCIAQERLSPPMLGWLRGGCGGAVALMAFGKDLGRGFWGSGIQFAGFSPAFAGGITQDFRA